MGLPIGFMFRETQWIDDRGNVRQVSVAILDYLWEARLEIVEHIGPFDDAHEVMVTTRQRARDWIEANGIPIELDLGDQ